MKNIPDNTPENNMTLEDSIILLLVSMAKKEMSLSRLLDAKANKISQNMSRAGSVPESNSTKPSSSSPVLSPKSTATASATKSTATAKTSSVASSLPQPHTYGCGVSGSGKGLIKHKRDKFYGRIAGFEINARSETERESENSLFYYIGVFDQVLKVISSEKNVRVICPTKAKPSMIVFGKGLLEQKMEIEDGLEIITSEICDFTVIINEKSKDDKEFRMIICPEGVKRPLHDSGFMLIDNGC